MELKETPEDSEASEYSAAFSNLGKIMNVEPTAAATTAATYNRVFCLRGAVSNA